MVKNGNNVCEEQKNGCSIDLHREHEVCKRSEKHQIGKKIEITGSSVGYGSYSA